MHLITIQWYGIAPTYFAFNCFQSGSSCEKTMSILITIFTIIRVYIDYAIDYVFSLYYNSRKQSLPGSSERLLLESASSLAKKIREGRVTSEQVVRAFADRIRVVNGVLNAVVDERLDDAVAEAKSIDADIVNGRIAESDFKRKPFLGE